MTKHETPLSVADRKKETLKQYLELQALVTDKTKERVKQLQLKLPQDQLPPNLRINAAANIFMSPDGSKIGTDEDLQPS